MHSFFFRSILICFSLFAAKGLLATDSVYLFKEANIRMDISGSVWHLQPRQEENGYIVYVFKRDPLVDSAGRSIIPNVAVVIEDIDTNTDVITYSVIKRGKSRFDVDKMFIHGDGIIDFVNAVGYKGSYSDQMKHTVYVIHAINGNKGIQIIMDATAETFPQVDPEFRRMLKSFKKS